MRVLLSTYGSRGDVQPLAGLAVRLRALGAEVRVCVPPDEDFAELLARVGVPLVLAGSSVRAMVTGVVTGAVPRPAEYLPRRAAEVYAAQFETLAAAAEGCDALVATGLFPAAAAARSVTEKLGIRYVYAMYQPIFLPSPHHPPHPWPGHPLPADVTDNRVLWDLDAQSMNEIFGPAINAHRASIGLPEVDHVRSHVFTDHPWLAADPVLAPWQEPADLDVVQTGAWILPDERPLPAELEAFLDAGAPPVYVGFGSMPLRATQDIARAAVEAVRAQGRRALIARGGPTWPWPTAGTTVSPSARSTSRRCSAGWLPSCTTAARARRRRQPGPARLRWWYPRSRTSRTGPAGWPALASARHTTVRFRPPSPCRPR
jgi:vancomycin aglycone glucosyltransferase